MTETAIICGQETSIHHQWERRLRTGGAPLGEFTQKEESTFPGLDRFWTSDPAIVAKWADSGGKSSFFLEVAERETGKRNSA